MINQNNREEIIKLLDSSKDDVSIEDLFLFDLSPYYDEKLDESFFSKQLEFIQEKNRLHHNPNISFTNEQIWIYQKLLENRRSIVSAPTSFGKTMLIKEYIFNKQPNKVVFIVPTNSLADELLDDFKLLYSDLGYIIFDSIKKLDTIIEKSIFIGTQEKYYNLKEFYVDKIDLFVIDEAYKLTDPVKGSREVILNRSFIDTLENSEKMILLMPLVNSIVGLEHLNFKILKSDYAPVAKSFNAIKKLDLKINEEINKNDNTSLVYFNYPKNLEKFYLKNLKSVQNPLLLNNEWIQRVEDDFHPDWLPIQALKSGIGIHYGPMPKFIQKKVIDLFKSRQIKNVLATNSIIEGVNTPTKNIYIVTSKDILGKNDLVRYKNLIGRAGRLGEHKVGNIFYLEKHQTQFEEANVSYKDINIKFILEDKSELFEVNREDNFSEEFVNKDQTQSVNNLDTYFEDTSYSEIPQSEVIKLIDKHGFTVKQLKLLLEYIRKDNIKLLGIIGTLVGKTDLNSLNVTLNSKFSSFNDMVQELHSKNEKIDKSKVISTLIDMIYSFLPFKVVPLLNFIIDIDELYKEYSSSALFSNKVIIEAKKKKAQFYSKFIGLNNPTHESLVVVNKLFEYGIPYHRTKPFLETITNSIPEKFSIHDIKKIVFEDESMNELKIYFE